MPSCNVGAATEKIRLCANLTNGSARENQTSP
jgi:hypothetical protein